MKINVFSSKKELDYEVACEIARLIKSNSDTGYPTHILIPAGRTPIGIYRNLVKFNRRKRLDFVDVHLYMLDEILVPYNNYEELLRRELIDKVNIKPENFHFVRKDICITNDIVDLYKKELIIDEFEQRFDLCLLGIGEEDGHFAMITDPVKEKDVFSTTWNNFPAVSVGLNQILNSVQIILIANTKEKRTTIKQVINSLMDNPQVPASYLKGYSGFILAITKDLL